MKRIKSLILALAATTVMLWGQTEVSTPIIPSWEWASEGATVISLSLQQAKDTAIRYNRQLQNASYGRLRLSKYDGLQDGDAYPRRQKPCYGRRYGKRYRAGKPT